MFKIFSINVIIIAIMGTVFFTGCSYKYYRSKPTTYINLKQDRNISSQDYNISMLDIHCIDKDENSTNVSEIGRCDDYLTADISLITFLNIENNTTKGKKNIRKLANDLFYIADSNCKTFQEKFYYNLFMEDNANKLLDLNILGVGIGIDFNQAKKMSHGQFIQLNSTLLTNLKERINIKTHIENNITNEGNYTTENLLVDMIKYDSRCSLFERE